ncbi:MAG: hypothetical protein HEEMFOPI_01958 [Holosporales bacterium]
MKFFCFLILIKILSAAQNIDQLPLLIPNDFKILIDAFKEATEVDALGQSKKTLRQVKEIMDPLKGTFDELATIEKMGELVKDFEEKVREYDDYYYTLYDDSEPTETIETIEKIANAHEEAVESYKDYKAGNIAAFLISFSSLSEKLRPASQTEHSKTLVKFMSVTYNLMFFYNDLKKNKAELSSFLSPGTTISYVLNFPKEKLDAYCPLDLQKIFFPFYMVAALRAVFKTCDLILDEEKENIISLCGAPLLIIDVTDKLDEPFFHAFDIMLKNCSLDLKHISIKRLLENILFILDHHVKFVEL